MLPLSLCSPQGSVSARQRRRCSCSHTPRETSPVPRLVWAVGCPLPTTFTLVLWPVRPEAMRAEYWRHDN